MWNPITGGRDKKNAKIKAVKFMWATTVISRITWLVTVEVGRDRRSM